MSENIMEEKKRLAARGRANTTGTSTAVPGAVAVSNERSLVPGSQSVNQGESILSQKKRIARGKAGTSAVPGAVAVSSDKAPTSEDQMERITRIREGTAAVIPGTVAVSNVIVSGEQSETTGILREGERIALRGSAKRGLANAPPSIGGSNHTGRGGTPVDQARDPGSDSDVSEQNERRGIKSRGLRNKASGPKGNSTTERAEEPGIVRVSTERSAASAARKNNDASSEDENASQEGRHGTASGYDAGEEPVVAHLVDDTDIENRIIQEKQEEIRTQIFAEATVATEVKRETCWQKYKLTCCLVSLVVVVVIIVLSVTLPNSDTAPLTSYDYLLDLAAQVSGLDNLVNETAAQHKALNWLALEDKFEIAQDESNKDVLLDRYVVALLYFAMGGAGWPDQMNFLANSSVCEWPPIAQVAEDETLFINGIRCNSNGRVNQVRLDFNNLTGAILPELSAMDTLTILSLRGNSLTGSLPPSLGRLPNLNLLAFPENHLTGPIPNEIGNIKALEILALAENGLTGTLPGNVTKIGTLQVLSLAGNSLQGSIPEFKPRSAMQKLELAKNNFSGTIPESIFALRSLDLLHLYSNSLTGSLSSKIGSLQSLTDIRLYGNSLSGTIPSALGKLGTLTHLFLFENRFNGHLPAALGMLGNLEVLEIQRNSLTGPIPSSFGGLNGLFVLNVAQNTLTGTIPSSLLGLLGLSEGFIGLHNNSFTGSLDQLFCNETIFPRPGFLTGDCSELECPCCTDCCSDETGECKVVLQQICESTKSWFENEVYASASASCDCFDEGSDLSCADTCSICNLDETACIENYDYGIEFTEDGSDHRWKCNMKYNVGGDNDISYNHDLLWSNCSIAIDGTGCSSCLVQRCSDGQPGLRLDCSNIAEGAVYDDCDASLDGGELLWFFNPEYLGGNCEPCSLGLLK